MGERTDQWVCMPCFTMAPKVPGYVNLPKVASEPMWCPWCGDKMEKASRDLLGTQELYYMDKNDADAYQKAKEERNG